MGLIHAHVVFYDQAPQPGHKYRQLVIIQGERAYELRMREGDVILTEPFTKEGRKDWAEFRLYSDLKTALEELEKEYWETIKNGWIQHGGFG